MNVPGYVEPLIVAVIAAIPGLLAYRQATTANRATVVARRVEIEAGAYERARELYESALDQLQKQLASIQVQLNTERDISAKLRNQVNALEDTVARLRRQLILHGVTEPEDKAAVLKVRPRHKPTDDQSATGGQAQV